MLGLRAYESRDKDEQNPRKHTNAAPRRTPRTVPLTAGGIEPVPLAGVKDSEPCKTTLERLFGAPRQQDRNRTFRGKDNRVERARRRSPAVCALAVV